MSDLLQQLHPLEFADFSGGITENYVEAPLNKYQKADNLLITPNRKLLIRPGSQLLDPLNPQTPDGNQRIGSFVNYDHDALLLQQVGRDVFYIQLGVFNNLKGPTGNNFFNAGDNNSLVASTQWNRHVILSNDAFASIQKVYRDGAGVLQVRSAGLPRLSVDPVATPGVGANSYLYIFLYQVTYFVDTVEFQTFGPTREIARVSSAAAPNITPIAITGIPVLSNGATENWDTANIVVQIYRTTNNGIPFFKVGEVINGTTTFNDTVSDATLILNEALYTNGGRVDNDPPPPAKYVHIVNGTCLYAHIRESGETISNRVRQSLPNIIDAAPGSAFVDVEEEITGISSVKGIPIVLCKKAIYRLDGTFDELGRGVITYQKINDTAGCVSHKGIVQTVDGIFWPGNDGFYFSDGYKVLKISNGFNVTYKSLVSNDTQKKNIVGAYEELNRRVWWAVQVDGSSLDNDTCYILDLRWGVTEESSFTTISGGLSFNPTAIVFFNKDFIRGDKHGYAFRHSDDLLTDPRVDQFAATSAWGVQTIIWDFRSAATNFGDSKNRKWVPRIVTSLKNDSNISLQIISNNDDSRQVLPLTPIRFRGNILWGDLEPVWGDDSILWNKQGLISNLRRFPASSLRCMYKQIQLTNAYVNVIGSDNLGTVTTSVPSPITVFNANEKIVTLDDSVNFSWNVSDIDYYMSFSGDLFELTYKVAAFSPTALTIVDPNNTVPIGSGLKWVLRGFPKAEVFDLLSFTLFFASLSPSQKNAITTAAADGLPTG